MKKLFAIATFIFVCSNIQAQQIDHPNPSEKTPSFYCAKMKDGLMVLVNEGKEVMQDVVLSNGSKITMDCTLIKADGTNVKLQNGECVSPEGAVVSGVQKQQPKKKNK